MNKNLNQTSEGQIIAGNVKQDDSEGKSGKSCGQSLRSPPLDDSSNGWDPNSGLISLVKALEASEPNQGSGQLIHSSPPDLANNPSGLDFIVPKHNEYSLGDESVSDLLAEIEAMESLNGLASLTSILRCDGHLAQGSELDCLSRIGGLSPALNLGQSDALSSTNDLQKPSQSTVTNEPFWVSQSEVVDTQKSSDGHSSTGVDMDEDLRPSDVSVNQYEAGSKM
ncbi:hypothetical protein QQP08_006478 [Theobroma cacao]|nr:hypothetical protein QQP08_006478 [Theobroma cacao]